MPMLDVPLTVYWDVTGIFMLSTLVEKRDTLACTVSVINWRFLTAVIEAILLDLI